VRTASVRRLRETLAPRSYELLSATLALRLLRQCVVTWTVLVAIWTVDVIARCVLGYVPETDWAFLADCAIDVIAKTPTPSPDLHPLALTSTPSRSPLTRTRTPTPTPTPTPDTR